MNDGKFVYALDDPYIHMSLAENIWNGHYGLNYGENSAPSSSILWPFLLAPFSILKSKIYAPLILNIIFCTLIIVYFCSILELVFSEYPNQLKSRFVNILCLVFILSTNIVTNIFTGMEHSLQVLLTVLVVYNYIYYEKNGKLAPFVCLAIIAAPLVRYENIVFSMFAIIFLFYRKKYKEALSVSILMFSSLLLFAIFLKSMGMGFLPSSIKAKSIPIQGDLHIFSIYENFASKILAGEAYGLLVAFIFLAISLFMDARKSIKIATLSILSAILAHFLFGGYGSLGRYGSYMLVAAFIFILFLYNDKFKNKFKQLSLKPMYRNLLGLTIVILVSNIYIVYFFNVCFASNNIYEQQYQMHRFSVSFLKEPVAVNDIGYVSFGNKKYVLDLIGLASKDMLMHRTKSNYFEFIQTKMKEENVNVAIVYDKWFEGITKNWRKMGSISFEKRMFSTAEKEVCFYYTGQDKYKKYLDIFNSFAKTLPDDIVFFINKANE